MAVKIIKSYQTLLDHFEPITKVIIERLESITNPEDKIKYLKSEEIKYLIDVTMNPKLMAASGIVTTANPHKAGLDRWIDLKIKEIETDDLSINPNKIIKSYVWQSNPDKELPELHRLMIDKYKLIASETTYEQFKAVFTGQIIDDSFEPIKWHQDNASELLYFIYRLEQTNNIVHNPLKADYKKLAACFVKPDGEKFDVAWKSLKTNIEINLIDSKQRAIDELVKIFS
jgi:hypothetical protein